MSAGNAVTRTATNSTDTSIGWRVAAVVACALVVVAYVLQAALPATPFVLPGPDAKTVRVIVPQGWAFFTKSPRSKSAVVYQHESAGGWRNITAGPLAHPRDVMGLDRTARAQGTEVGMLLSRVPQEAWRDCDGAPIACLSAATAAATVPNRSNLHSVCGEVGMVVQEVVPWAWRDAPTVMPSKVLRVRVTC